MWLGEKIPLDLSVFKRMKDERARLDKLQENALR